VDSDHGDGGTSSAYYRYMNRAQNLEPRRGIEPRPIPYQGIVLPLDYQGSETGAASRTRTETSSLENCDATITSTPLRIGCGRGIEPRAEPYEG
jgi:hypothetical protein